jgi:hypothetical protein
MHDLQVRQAKAPAEIPRNKVAKEHPTTYSMCSSRYRHWFLIEAATFSSVPVPLLPVGSEAKLAPTPDCAAERKKCSDAPERVVVRSVFNIIHVAIL